ncbi:hypothetical protein AAMO2058_000570000 [Amorphochlora amoebiformis]
MEDLHEGKGLPNEPEPHPPPGDDTFQSALRSLRGSKGPNTKAIKLLKAAVVQHHTRATAVLANCYITALGLYEKNISMGEHWYDKAAQLGDSQAQLNMCIVFLRRYNHTKDNNMYHRAYKWLFKAAVKGFPPAISLIKGRFSKLLRRDMHKEKTKDKAIKIFRSTIRPTPPTAPLRFHTDLIIDSC